MSEFTIQTYRPTLRERIWRVLGFGRTWDEDLFDWRAADPAPGDWWTGGQLHTTTIVRVRWPDRLRLVVSGRCQVDCYSRTDVIIERAETRSLFSVLRPGPR